MSCHALSPVKVGLLTLGCDKNTVDSERYLAELLAHGAESTTDLDEAEVIIVNTCGFIDAAKRESIDAIVEAGRYKTDGVCQAVVAVGCLVQRHKDELADALPEVDLFLGAAEDGSADSGADRARAARRSARRSSGRARVLGRPAARSLSQDQRRVRPRLRVLRDPAHARQASLVRAG